jgi:hypothetical protein
VVNSIANWTVKPPTQNYKFAPGFRISFSDVAVLIIGIFVSFLIGRRYWPLSMIVLVVLGHFFLFCNVFRLSRSLELAWAGAFLLFLGLKIDSDFMSWEMTMALIICVTHIVVICEMKKPSYHGILWWRINPNLKDWWDSNLSQRKLY